jgi:biopolymer transport protein ExbD
MIRRKEARSIIRKALKRVPEGEEIRHLNIMPMMDIMTILLVAFIYSANQDISIPVDVEMPESRSFSEKVESAVTLTIAKSGILIQGRPIVNVKNGAVDSAEKKGGALGVQIPRVSGFLGKVRGDIESQMKAQGKTLPDTPELFIIADKSIPYKLLFEVIVSSRSPEAGYKRFRLIVLQDA